MADQEEHHSDQPRRRRPATTREAKALSHPLRIRILRQCLLRDLTNKELADRLDTTPGTVLHHVRTLVAVGLLVPGEPRTGAGGALEKPYRATGESWWLDGPLLDTETGSARPLMEAFQAEMAESGTESMHQYARFALHLSDEEAQDLERRIIAILDEYVATDGQRRDRPVYGGLFLLHRIVE